MGHAGEQDGVLNAEESGQRGGEGWGGHGVEERCRLGSDDWGVEITSDNLMGGVPKDLCVLGAS